MNSYMIPLLVGLITILAGSITVARPDYSDATPDERALFTRVDRLVAHEKWNDLEQWIDECKSQKSRTNEGILDLVYISMAMSPTELLDDDATDEEWLDKLKILESWKKVSTNKDLVETLIMEFWLDYAWKARGDGFASTVTEEGYKIYKKRLLNAQKLYEAFDKNTPHCMHWYYVTLRLSRSLGWSNEKAFEQILLPGLKLNPEHITLYREFCFRLQPRWYGEKNDDYRFLKKLLLHLPDDVKNEVYTRLVIMEKLNEIQNFQPDLTDWEAMKLGFTSIVKKYPDAIGKMSEFINFADRYEAIPEAVRILRKNSPNGYKRFCESSPFGSAIALSETLESSLQKVNYFKPEGNRGVDRVTNIAWMADGSHYFAASEEQGVRLFSANSTTAIDQFKPLGKTLRMIAISPDNKFLAAASSFDAQMKLKSSTIYILEINSNGMKLIKKFEEAPRKSISLAFSQDGKLLFSAHATERSKGTKPFRALDVCSWSQEDAKFETLYRLEGSTYYIRGLTPSPDGQWMYFSAKDLFRCSTINNDKSPEKLRSFNTDGSTYIRNLAFVNEGKQIVTLKWSKEAGSFIDIYAAESGEIVAHNDLTQLAGGTYFLAGVSHKKEFFATGEYGGLLRFSYDNSSNNIDLLSVDYGNGQAARSLAVSPVNAGQFQITLGTEKGMIGNWWIQYARE